MESIEVRDRIAKRSHSVSDRMSAVEGALDRGSLACSGHARDRHFWIRVVMKPRALTVVELGFLVSPTVVLRPFQGLRRRLV